MAAKKSQAHKGDGGMLAAEIGAGMLAAAAAGASYYFYGVKGAKKHRAAATKWAKELKTTVVKQAKKVDQFDKKTLATIVDNVTKSYETVKGVKPEDLRMAANELKTNWEAVQAELQRTGKKAVKSVAAPAKKSAKAVVKKSAPAKKVVKKVAKKK